MKPRGNWAFGGFERDLCEGYYEIFIVAVRCGLSESRITQITQISRIMVILWW